MDNSNKKNLDASMAAALCGVTAGYVAMLKQQQRRIAELENELYAVRQELEETRADLDFRASEIREICDMIEDVKEGTLLSPEDCQWLLMLLMSQEPKMMHAVLMSVKDDIVLSDEPDPAADDPFPPEDPKQ